MECCRRNPTTSIGVVAISLLLVAVVGIPKTEAAKTRPPVALENHGGQMLKGNLDLSLVFYGQLGRVQKSTLRSFLRSLNQHGPAGYGSQVSSWWRMVSAYVPGGVEIKVRVAKQYVDPRYSLGKVLTRDFIMILVKNAVAGLSRAVPVIVAARDVSVQGLCMGKCAEHGVIDGIPYVIIGNPVTECPGACAWPFHRADYGPPGAILKPPSGDVAADAMVVSLASGLASVVTNPFQTGLFQIGEKANMVEASTACPGMFGTGATPGYTGKVAVDPRTGGAYNAVGFRGKKFLLPALWNPKTSSCWTVM
ncbi:protein EXORDIUM-like 2 [Benincasa hispida]|uniref:protein EXORDIUM-like 2 n=1 Tax=Benincasa hispida TaxID=102211 RepID=UPI0018FF472A|nr:protein EXORDIUM-like 2 [Benincasa hispida]